MTEVLLHCAQCRSPDCEHPNCYELKWMFRHKMQCTVGVCGGCNLCKRVWNVVKMHSRSCDRGNRVCNKILQVAE